MIVDLAIRSLEKTALDSQRLLTIPEFSSLLFR